MVNRLKQHIERTTIGISIKRDSLSILNRRQMKKEACDAGWSIRTLDRNISTQYYYRLLKSLKKEAVIAEMQEKTSGLQDKKYELIKSPMVMDNLMDNVTLNCPLR